MTRIKVAVRVRPLSNREIETGSTSIIAVENHNTIAITNMKVPEQNAGDSRERIRRFTFDYCFQESSTQDHIFEAIESVIGQSIKKRFHSCVLAYGQSSSGKTHTMMGFPHDPGLTPKLCDRVFDYLQETAVGEEVLDLKVSVSYLEIYNEKVRDLLCCEETDRFNIAKKTQPLRIREHPKKGPYVQGLSEHRVVDSSGLLEWLEKGNKQRRVAATLTNPQSSRSHSVFSISCDGVKLHLIDLAGSERAGNRCYSTSQFREGANINKSLVALGNVISALAEQTSKQAKSIRRKFVPYRDSILTWLLKDTLGGNSNTVMVATVSPSSACYNETVNTLRFGQRAKLIVSHPVVNEDPKEKTIRELRAEIAKLRDLLKLSQLSPELLSQDSMLARANSFEKNGITEENQTDRANIAKPFPVLEPEELFENIKKENISIAHIGPLNENEINENSININESNKHGAESATDNSIQDHISVNNDNMTLTANANAILDKNSKITTEKLLPLINVSSSIIPTKPTKLRRTFSVDHSYTKLDNGEIKMFGSEESIPSTSTISQKSSSSIISEKQEAMPLASMKKATSSSITSLRRRSLNKSNPSLPKTVPKRKSLENNPNKAEKSVATETLNIKKVESKVDSIRRYNIKPRAQIVAAVTSRLYSKTKKKEVATDTHDINTNKNELPKELTICTQARTRLKELTRRALRAHKYKDVDTQTDLFPVLRFKEISTDVADLRIMLAEVKDAETESDVITTKDASVDCPGFNNFSDEETRYKSILFTRTCGTQFPEDCNIKNAQESTNITVLPSTRGPPNTISFTKYLRDTQESNFEISDIIPNSPIYTNAVNINISHNYINGNRLNDSASDDSIDNHNGQNVCFPTPDLISNHNSLEQQSHDIPGPSKSEINSDNPNASQIQYADIEILLEHFTNHESFIPPSNKNVNYTVARCSMVPKCTEKLQSINISNVQAPEICIVTDFREDACEPFGEFAPELAKSKIVVNKDFKCDDCITLEEPLVLKSIVKQIPKSKPVPVHYLSSSDEDVSSTDLPDSLDYHMANNKKVKFPGQDSNNPQENQRMVKAMSDFLQEATQLMSTLSVAANNISVGNNLHLDDSYDFEVTLNGVSGLKKPSRKRRRKVACKKFTTNMPNTNGATFPVSKSDCCTQCEIVVPINKYEALVEDSCRRLEEKINRKPISRPKVHISNDFQDYNDDILDPFSEQLTYNPWDLSHPSNSNDVEDSSLESNPVTFSDYGSLPRKTHKRHRTPTCSPSAFLRQLTNMRKQIIESSREELLGGSNSH